MSKQRLEEIRKVLDDLRIKAGLLLGKLKLVAKVLITKTKPIPLGDDGLLELIQHCMSKALELSKVPLLEQFGLWTWYFECFDIIKLYFKTQFNLQEVLQYLSYLIHGIKYIIDTISYMIINLPCTFKLTT